MKDRWFTLCLLILVLLQIAYIAWLENRLAYWRNATLTAMNETTTAYQTAQDREKWFQAHLKQDIADQERLQESLGRQLKGLTTDGRWEPVGN